MVTTRSRSRSRARNGASRSPRERSSSRRGARRALGFENMAEKGNSGVLFQPRVLTADQLRHLHVHRYTSGTASWLDSNMNHYWEWVVQFVPMWVSPNVITLLGLLSMLVTTGLSVWYSPDLKAPMPRWVALANALGLFAYQTLDAIDGKQARRTGTSSPLGQLFDHGCDAVSGALIGISAGATLRMGFSRWLIILLGSLLLPFFLGQWEEFTTKVMRTNVGGIGVTEGQMFALATYLLIGLGEEGLLHKVVTLRGTLQLDTSDWPLDVSLQLWQLVVLFSMGTLLSVGVAYLWNVIWVERKPLHTLKLIPLVASFGAASILCVVHNPLLQHAPWAVLLTFTVTLAHLVNRIIIAAVAQAPFPVFQWTIVPICLMVVYPIFGLEATAATASAAAWSGFAVALLHYMWYSGFILLDLRDFLDVPLLWMKKRAVS